jgi:universal stress protein A
MFRHILVPTDFSKKSNQALDIALKLVDIKAGQITLLHVIETIQNASYEEFADFYDKLKQNAECKMAEILKGYPGPEKALQARVTFGNRVGRIVSYAAEHDVDLIILSSHRLEPENISQGWGSISYKVGLLSHCPVMMVK